ncbi:MAG: peptidylprolyl isomerase [Actinomycetota bacterium]|nr:peptidylprolyl isomerase [Actinomycetota bacterium]
MAGNSDRQRRLAREKYRQQQELRAARQRQLRRRGLIGASAVLAAALIASLLLTFLPGGSKHPTASPSKSPSATPSATTVAEPAHHCTYAKATPAARTVSLPPPVPDYTGSYQATINTNLGKFALNLLNSKATCTVNSFVHLAEAGYFNNTQCHRLLTSGIYVLQCGDPYATASTKLTCSSTGKIGTGTPGYDFASENLTGAKYPAGTVAMANEGSASTNGSQFFIVYKDSTSGLGPSYTPFATVSSGLNIVQNVAKEGYACHYTVSGQTEGGAPKDKVIIDSVTIKKT